MSEPLRVGVLASGRGSNFRALAEAAARGRIPAAMVVLISDRAAAPVLDIAREHHVEAMVLDPRQHPSREAHEKAVIGVLEERRVGLVCLAGYMRLLSGGFVGHFAGRMLNIHPSLLPAFPGLHPHRQALAHGVRVSGATVHFVDDGVDTAPSFCRPRCRCGRTTPRRASPRASWPRSTGSTRRRCACSRRAGSRSGGAGWTSGA